MNKGRVKAFLDELGVPNEQRAEILGEAKALALKAGATKPGNIGLTLFVALVFSGCSLRLLSGFSAAAQSILAVLIAIVIVYGMLKLNSGAWWQFLKPHLATPLEARGFRFCPHCLYNFRGIPPETEYCPECSVYISKRGATVQTPLDVRIVHPSVIPKDHKLVVTGIELSPAQQEEILMIMFPPKKSRDKWASVVGWLFAIVIVVCVFIAAQSPKPTVLGNARVMAAIIVGGAIVAYLGFCFMRLFVQVRRYPRRFRQAARQIGVEICLDCGQFLGEMDSSNATCSGCGSPRLAMFRSQDV